MPNIDVRNHYCKWFEQIPSCLKPKDDSEREKFVDLVLRTLFYFSLDDSYLQKKLSDISESDQTLLKFYETAISAEAQRLHYQETNEKAGILDSSSAVSVVNKFEGSSHSEFKSGHHNSRRGRGGGHQQQSHRQQQNQQQQHQDQQHQTEQHQHSHKQSIQLQQKDTQKIYNNSNDYYKKNQHYNNSYKSNKFNKKPFNCYHCGHDGHSIYKCLKYNSMKKTTTAHKASMENINNDVSNIDIVNIQKLTTFDSYFKTEVFNVKQKLAPQYDVMVANVGNSSGNIMAGVILNNSLSCMMEIDTGASQSMMPFTCFQKLVSRCQEDGIIPPILEENTVIMRQADGTSSKMVKGCTYLCIQRTDKPERGETFKVLVVQGPNNLLGRNVLEKLWSEQYDSLANTAQQSLQALGTESVCEADCVSTKRSTNTASLATMASAVAPATPPPPPRHAPDDVTAHAEADQLPPVALSSDVIAPATATTTEALTQTKCATTIQHKTYCIVPILVEARHL